MSVPEIDKVALTKAVYCEVGLVDYGKERLIHPTSRLFPYTKNVYGLLMTAEIMK
jgi:hypothetical protein